MPRVLVTDCNSRKALCTVRSLGKKGFDVIAISDDKINMSRFSKYCSNFIHSPSLIRKKNEFLDFLSEILKQYEIDVLIPMEDETVELLLQNQEIFKDSVTLLPDYNTFEIARDKGKTIKRAIESGMPCPKTYFVQTIKEINVLKDELIYPVIIKPRKSSGSRGIVRVSNKEDFIKSYQEIHKDYPFPIIQQYISGNLKKIQVLLIMDFQSDVKAICTYEGIREFPVNGGPVTLWKTVSLDDIENRTIKYLKDINWVGFAEIEYILDETTGEYFLMEINPRFSANIALAVNLGIDFPLFYTKIALNEKVGYKRNTLFNEYCQWLLPGDILNFIFNKDRFRQEIGYFFKKPKKLYYAVLSKDDPLPVLAVILSLFINIFKNFKNLSLKLRASR